VFIFQIIGCTGKKAFLIEMNFYEILARMQRE